MGAMDKSPYPFDLPDNSKAARAERQQKPETKRAEKVVKGTVKVKKNEMRKLTDVFISEDVVNVKSYIIFDVLVPSIKRAIYDIVVNSLDMSLFGGRGGKRSTKDNVSYDLCSSSGRRDHSDRNRKTSGRIRNYDDLVFDTYSDADAVLTQLDEIMDTYKIVRVADLYESADITPDYTAHDYGWTDIRSAEIVSVRDGYKIKMPRALPIR